MAKKTNKAILKEYFKKQLDILGVKDEVILVCSAPNYGLAGPNQNGIITTRKQLFSDYLVDSYGTAQFAVFIAKMTVTFCKGLIGGGISILADYLKSKLPELGLPEKVATEDAFDIVSGQLEGFIKGEFKTVEIDNSCERFIERVKNTLIDGFFNQFDDEKAGNFMKMAIEDNRNRGKDYRELIALWPPFFGNKNQHTMNYMDDTQGFIEGMSSSQKVAMDTLTKEFAKEYIDANEYWNYAIDWLIDLAIGKVIKIEKEWPPKPVNDDIYPPRPNPAQTPRDPLIIDLNRDGKVSTTPGKRYFDMDANGFAEQVSWAASGDGFLVLDRDGDGNITSGRELFGDSTVMSDGKVALNGFQALADLDSNGDGIIDARDELFSQLRIWADKDGDGVFGDKELFTLEEIGIESIDLGYTEERTVDENGNLIVRTGKVTWKDGDTSPVSEFLLDRNTVKSDYDRVAVDDDITILPDLNGMGYLYSLHQAMARDESGRLKGLLEQFMGEGDSGVRRSLLDAIMLRWAETSNLQSSQHGGWLGFLDKYYGGLFIGTPTEEGWRQLQNTYETISLCMYGKLLQQTHYADLYMKIESSWDESEIRTVKIGAILEDIAKGYAYNPEQTKRSITEFFLVLKTTGLYQYIKESDIAEYSQMLATYGAELVNAYRAGYLAQQGAMGEFSLPTFIDLDPRTNRDRILTGGVTNDVLVGSDKKDILKGERGSDTLIGGKGDDILSGGADSDVYLWNLGDGNDTIMNSTSGSGEIDVLRIGEGVLPENVKLERYGNTIRIVIGESGERITLATDTSEGFPYDPLNPHLQLARVEFADGTVWKREYMLNLLQEYNGTDGSETLEGSSGRDILRGNKGDDLLKGGYGSDTYIWKIGDGNDTLEDIRFEKDENILKLEGVTPDGIELLREGYSLILHIKQTGERITLPKWYGQHEQDRYRIHGIEFDNGVFWTTEDMNNAKYEDFNIVGTPNDDILDGSGGNDLNLHAA